MQNLTHNGFMDITMAKYNYLVQKKKWRQKSMGKEMIMALSTEVAQSKEEPKQPKNVSDGENGKNKIKRKKKDVEKEKKNKSLKKMRIRRRMRLEKRSHQFLKILKERCYHNCTLGKDQGKSLKPSPTQLSIPMLPM